MTRAWRSPTGEYLIEGDPSRLSTGYTIRTAADLPVTSAHTYWELDSAGTVQRVYEATGGAIDDYAYGHVYEVVDGDLHQYWTEYHTVTYDVHEDGMFNRTNREHIIHVGLVEVPLAAALGVADNAEADAALRAARADWRRRQNEWQAQRLRPIVELKESFAAVLPPEPVDLVFGYDDGAVVRRVDGRVLWRPAAPWPHRGKDMFYSLREVLKQRYGDRTGSFTLDIDDAPWWFWAPDD